MNDTTVSDFISAKVGLGSSSPVAGAQASLGDEVTVHLHPQGIPLFVMPVSKRLKSDFGAFHAWLVEHEQPIDKLLLEFGAVRFRGFSVKGAEQFRDLMSHYPDATMGYKGGGGPRASVLGKVMESTRTLKDRFIPLHQELSYQRQWPLKLAFYSNVVASSGGTTTIGDIRAFEARIPQRLIDEVRERGVLYRRNFRDGRAPMDGATGQFLNMHRPWQEAFFTEDKADVESACDAAGLQWKWLDDGSLQTDAYKSGFVTHPVLGTSHWFNQISNLTALPPPDTRLWYNTLTAEDYQQGRRYPNEILFGDGSKIPTEDVALLRQIEDEVLVDEPWQAGEVMLLDNVLCSHGRTPFEGQRDTLVQLLGTGSN